MVTGHEVTLDDLPKQYLLPSTEEANNNNTAPTDWTAALQQQAQSLIQESDTPLNDQLTPLFEKTLIEVALQHTSGKKVEAARLIGWGRNTLTRKLKELNISS